MTEVVFTLQSFVHVYSRPTFLQDIYITKILESRLGVKVVAIYCTTKFKNNIVIFFTGNSFTCKWLLTWEMDSKSDFIISSIALGFASAINNE